MATTYQDAIDHLVDYLGGTPTADVQRDCRRAILEAYRDLTNASRWTYLLTQGRVITSAPLTDGTIAYDNATRKVTLTPLAGSPVQAWPSWAMGGYLRIGFVAGKCVLRDSDTVISLDPVVNFGQDLVAGTPYKFYRDSYLLPADFVAADQALYERNFGGMSYVHPHDWLFEERFIFAEGTPQAYTITGDPLFPGRLLIRLAPLPSELKTIDYLYHRRPRALTMSLASAGAASMVGGDFSLTGVGTAFAPAMVGAVVRLSASAVPPTSLIDKNPAAFETRIVAWMSPTLVILADPAPADLNGGAYTISDPVDVEEGGMLNAFLRCCEMHIATNRTLKDKPSASAQYKMALDEARAADSRSFAGRSVGVNLPFRQRLRDMPISFADTAN